MFMLFNDGRMFQQRHTTSDKQFDYEEKYDLKKSVSKEDLTELPGGGAAHAPRQFSGAHRWGAIIPESGH